MHHNTLHHYTSTKDISEESKVTGPIRRGWNASEFETIRRESNMASWKGKQLKGMAGKCLGGEEGKVESGEKLQQ